MAELNTVARPYAKAAFEYALATQREAAWQEMLELLAVVASDPAVTTLIKNPSIEATAIYQFFVDVCGDKIDDKARNFVHLLAVNKRLEALPAIYQGFEELKAENEQSVVVKVRTTVELGPEQANQVVAKLEQRLNKKVQLEPIIDPSILGGMVIEANDLVIDGSVRNKLAKLEASLRS